jgi:peptide/nickel transport system permease protein
MLNYIIRRTVIAVIVLLVVVVLVFLIMRLLPGDPILTYIGVERLKITSPEGIEALRHQYGLDKPWPVQFFEWVGGIFRGDWGISIFRKAPVLQLIMARLPITIHLGVLAFLLSIFIGVTAGIVCAVKRGKFIDSAVTVMANLGITVPSFWLGIMMVYLFALYLGLLPVQGYTSPFQNFWLNTKQIIMPVICLSIFGVASSARQTRSSMLEVLSQDYIRTAWSKGLRERAIIIRHALKNSLIPVVTFEGSTLSSIVGGSVLIESVFNIQGMGRLLVDAVFNQDYAIVQGVILIVAFVVLFTNLLVDLSYGWLDPRVRYS